MKKALFIALFAMMAIGGFAQVVDTVYVDDYEDADTIAYLSEYDDMSPEELEKAMKDGDLEAGRALAGRYYVEENEARRIEVLEYLAAHGDDGDMLELGVEYIEAPEEYCNPKKGMRWLEKAEKNGNNDAGLYIAEVLLSDSTTEMQGLEKMSTVAEKCLEDNGSEGARKIADYYDDAKRSFYDPQKALEWRMKAVEAGDIDLAIDMAHDYEESGSAKDLDMAMRLYTMVSIVDDTPDGIIGMGNVYANKNYSGYDLKRAMDCYQKAANAGYSEGWLQMAVLYKDGYDGKPDLQKAMEALDKCSEADDFNYRIYNDLSSFYDVKGEIYSLQGNKDKAFEMWKEANDASSFYDDNDTPLNQYILANYSELTYENDYFSLRYPLDLKVREHKGSIEMSKDENGLFMSVSSLQETGCKSVDEVYEILAKSMSEYAGEEDRVEKLEPTTITLDGVEMRFVGVKITPENPNEPKGTIQCGLCPLSKENDSIFVILFITVDSNVEKLKQTLTTFKWK